MNAGWPRIDRSLAEPVAEQIAQHFARAVACGRLAAGQRLPPIRDVAERVGVTRATVQQAYRRLAERGVVTSTVGRGTEVSNSAAAADPISPAARAALAHLHRAQGRLGVPQGIEPVANFAEMLPDPAGFPADAFRDAMVRALDAHGQGLLGYGEPGGDRALRRALAERAGLADADCVLLTHGAQQAIDLCLRTFARAGDAIACFSPTYHQLFGVAEAQGLAVVPIDAGRDGDFAAGELERVLAGGVRALYVMPTFQNPTGRTLDAARRQALIEIVGRTNVPIVEDEVETALRFRGDEQPTLRSLDPRGLTATIGSFSKGLFPGVRLGWIEAGPELLEPLAAVKRYCDLETSPLLQAGVLEFLDSGGVARYLTGLRAELASRHAAAQRALAAHMPAGCRWTDPDGGFALWLELPPGTDADRVAEASARRGVAVASGRAFDPLDRPSSGLRLSLARTPVAAIDRGLRLLAECVRECARSPAPLFM